jgi:thioesterase domain-containing protein
LGAEKVTPQQLTEIILTQIPLAQALDFSIDECSESEAVVQGPFDANRNHMSTVFGGSLNAFAILACYAWTFRFLQTHAPKRHVLIKRGEMDFKHPVTGDFKAICRAPPPEEEARLKTALERGHRSRIVLEASIEFGGRECAHFKGEFVAF